MRPLDQAIHGYNPKDRIGTKTLVPIGEAEAVTQFRATPGAPSWETPLAIRMTARPRIQHTDLNGLNPEPRLRRPPLLQPLMRMTGGSAMQGDPTDVRTIVTSGTAMGTVVSDAMLGATIVVPLNHRIRPMITREGPLGLRTIVDPRVEMK